MFDWLDAIVIALPDKVAAWLGIGLLYLLVIVGLIYLFFIH